MRKWISFPKQVGVASKQAHADFPEQAIYEREVGRSGFFGPATHFHHRHAPTDWSSWEGELRPRNFDLNKLKNLATESPWQVPLLDRKSTRLNSSHVRISYAVFCLKK